MNSTDETISFFLYCWMQMNLNDGRCATCATILLFGNGAERHGHTVEKNDVTAERPRAASLHLRLSETNKSVAALSCCSCCWSAGLLSSSSPRCESEGESRERETRKKRIKFDSNLKYEKRRKKREREKKKRKKMKLLPFLFSSPGKGKNLTKDKYYYTIRAHQQLTHLCVCAESSTAI